MRASAGMTARCCPRPRLRIDDCDDHEDDEVVREQDHLAPHQPVDMYRQRCRQSFDESLIGDEHVGTLENRCVDEIPDHQAERDVGQMLLEWQLEQLGVQQPHGDRRRSRRDGDPERSQHRAPVALLDVLPAQVQPQLALCDAGYEIPPRSAHGPRLRGRVGKGHCLGPLDRSLRSRPVAFRIAPTAQAPQPNPLQQARRIAPRHQKVPADPHPLLRQQLAKPRLRTSDSRGCDRSKYRFAASSGYCVCMRPPRIGLNSSLPCGCRYTAFRQVPNGSLSAPAGGAVPPRPRGRTTADPAHRPPPASTRKQCAVEQRRDARQAIPPDASVLSSLTRRRHTSPRRNGNANRDGSAMSHTIGDTSANECLSAHATSVPSTSESAGRPSSSASHTQSAPSASACRMPSAKPPAPPRFRRDPR